MHAWDKIRYRNTIHHWFYFNKNSRHIILYVRHVFCLHVQTTHQWSSNQTKYKGQIKDKIEDPKFRKKLTNNIIGVYVLFRSWWDLHGLGLVRWSLYGFSVHWHLIPWYFLAIVLTMVINKIVISIDSILMTDWKQYVKFWNCTVNSIHVRVQLLGHTVSCCILYNNIMISGFICLLNHWKGKLSCLK